jgi:hypothetical protein
MSSIDRWPYLFFLVRHHEKVRPGALLLVSSSSINYETMAGPCVGPYRRPNLLFHVVGGCPKKNVWHPPQVSHPLFFTAHHKALFKCAQERKPFATTTDASYAKVSYSIPTRNSWLRCPAAAMAIHARTHTHKCLCIRPYGSDCQYSSS